ncbi:MAG: hypothetical protein ACXW3E_00680 [Thermoanaerobaculia bacterium]
MGRRIRWLYEWQGRPGDGSLERRGWIPEASLRAWEYQMESERPWEFRNGTFADTVRVWKTARPDLCEPERLLVGDVEEIVP